MIVPSVIKQAIGQRASVPHYFNAQTRAGSIGYKNDRPEHQCHISNFYEKKYIFSILWFGGRKQAMEIGPTNRY